MGDILRTISCLGAENGVFTPQNVSKFGFFYKDTDHKPMDLGLRGVTVSVSLSQYH
jgi:hypothetical protein